jgi:biopolymer transport protein ExbD
MKRAVEKMKMNNKKTTFVLQLTAMVDMFTILIVFLLKSFSTSSVHVTPHKGMELPFSSAYVSPVEATRLVVSLEGIFVDDKEIVKFENGQLNRADVERNDPDFIKALYDELDKLADVSKEIAEKNEDHEFEGKVVMQADQRLPYSILKKVMYTSSLAGYADMKLATFAE